MKPMALHPRFYKRDFTGVRVIMDARSVTVTRYSWIADGGPDEAEIIITGTAGQVWNAYNLLRCPVEIYDAHGRACWWGYVASVTPDGIFGGADLRDMANRVAVTYSEITADNPTGGVATETAFSEDASSTALFGDKEMKFSLSSPMTQTQAEQERDTRLGERAYPIPALDTTRPAKPSMARLVCRGWWHATDWQYYQNTNWRVLLEDTGQLDYAFSDDAARELVAQSFTTPATITWSIAEFAVKIRAVGTPGAAADITGSIRANNAGDPAAGTLATVTVQSDDIWEEAHGVDWVTWRFASPVALSAATLYWLVLDRDNASSASNYYEVKTCTGDKYTGGSMKIYNGAAWSSAGSGYDMKFRAIGERETSGQITDIVTNACQFLTATDIETASGIYTTPYRAGDKTALEEIENLLSSGTSADRRYHCTVTQARRLRVWLEAAKGAADHRLYPSGELGDAYGLALPAHWCTVGVWVSTRDVIPASVAVSTVIRPERFFIQRATYDARTGRTNYEPKIATSIYDIMVGVR